MSKKIIVSTLSTVMGVSLVGAITGTVAWYQYSTRSTVSFVGASIGSTRNLQVSLTENDADFKNDLKNTDLNFSHELTPITTGAQLKDGALGSFLAQPVYQHFGYDGWIGAQSTDYVQFTVYLRLHQVNADGTEEDIQEPRTIRLNEFAIQDDSANEVGDIAKAIRVHIASDQRQMLISEAGGNTDVYGYLDLNGDTIDDDDLPAFDFLQHNNPVYYGEENAVQESYSAAQARGLELGTLFSKKVTFAANEDFEDGVQYYEDANLENLTTDPEAVPNKEYFVSQPLMPVTVTIWLEGWQKLPVINKVKLANGYNLNNLSYYSDAEMQNLVAAGTPADGTTHYYVDADGDSVAEDIVPVAGQIMNRAHSYYTNSNLETLATGVANGNTEYYYDSGETSAMWDIATYVGAQFDVGLLFEVEE